jgi:hypothetical protein
VVVTGSSIGEVAVSNQESIDRVEQQGLIAGVAFTLLLLFSLIAIATIYIG